MSENNEPPAISDQVKKSRQLRYLFKGRFTDTQAIALLEHHNYDIGNATNYVFNNSAKDVSNFITTLTEDVVLQIQKDAEETCDELMNKKQTRVRLFACEPCDRVWWRKVPIRKQVSCCHGCKKRYDPVPKSSEFGWALYDCKMCGRQFSGFGQMGVASPCYTCHSQVIPTRIMRHSKRGPVKSRNTHSCDGQDCFNQAYPNGRRRAFHEKKSDRRAVYTPDSSLYSGTYHGYPIYVGYSVYVLEYRESSDEYGPESRSPENVHILIHEEKELLTLL